MRPWWRADVVPWDHPKPKPFSLTIVLVAALLSGAAIAAYRYAAVWTPLQRRYVFSYAWSGLALTASGSYDLLDVVDQKGHRLALDDDLVTVTSATGETSFALSDTAVTAGKARLVWHREQHPHHALHGFLLRWIYDGQTLLDLISPALWAALALLLGGIIGARAEGLVWARAWSARDSSRQVDWRRPPPVIEYAAIPPRSPDAFGSRPDGQSEQSNTSASAGLPATMTRSLPAGDATMPRGSSDRPSDSWPDPFFQ
jgi:hypothetical protein